MPMLSGLVRRLAECASVVALVVIFDSQEALGQDRTLPLALASHALGTNGTNAGNWHIALPPVDLVGMPEDLVTSPVHSGRRPAALLPLYISFASLQALDLASTTRALDRGAHEANPIVAPLTSSTSALIAVKAGSTAAIIYLTERLRKRHPVAAVVLMVGLNAGYASLIAHNYSVGGR